MPGKKIESTSGAAILLALLFFLLCAVAGSVVLAAGTASAGRVAGLKEDEQEYYTLTSAAKVIRDEITGEVISCWSLEEPSAISDQSEVQYNQEPKGYFQKLLKDAAAKVYMGRVQDADDYVKYMKITVEGDTENTLSVDARFTIDSKYNIDVVISRDSKSCTLHIPAALSLDASEESGQEKIPAGGIRYTTMLIWTDPVITNG